MKLFALPYLAIVLVLCACSSGGSSNGAQAAQQGESEKRTHSVLNILIPEAAADEPLAEYSVMISVSGGTYRQQKSADSLGRATFEELPAGHYTVTVVVYLGTFELTRAERGTIIGDAPKSELINIPLPRSDLQVGVKVGVETATLRGEYRGQARTTPYCFENDFLSGFGYATATTTINMSDGSVLIRAEIFSGLIIEFAGTYTDDGEHVEASGTYRSSDFKEGNWVLDGISEPKAGALFLAIRTEGDCETTLDLIGIKP